MHNGHYILANGSSTPAVVNTPKADSGNGGGRVDSGVYEGRHTRQYGVEEVEEVNLIDLC
jgi:hypothetical protein